MSDAAETFHSAVEAVRDWLDKSASSRRARSIDPELVVSLLHEIDDMRAALGFYADEKSWHAMPEDEFRRRFGSEPISEALFGRMRLRAPGKALPAAVADMGEKARRHLSVVEDAASQGGTAAGCSAS